MTRHRWVVSGAITACICIVLLLSLSYLLPLDSLLPVQRKPFAPLQKAYDYYVVVDEANQEVLMYVPLVVSMDDELITEDNRLFRVVRVEGNIAYARYIGQVKLEQERAPQSLFTGTKFSARLPHPGWC